MEIVRVAKIKNCVVINYEFDTANAGCDKTQLFHHIAWLWATERLTSIDLLLLIQGEDKCDNIENAINQIIGDENMNAYKTSKMRILILFDSDVISF